MLIEACAGLLEDESPEVRIRLELREETGYEIPQIRKVFEAYMSPGAVTEILHFFVAEYSPRHRVADGGGIDEEDIEVLELPFEQALAMIEDLRNQRCEDDHAAAIRRFEPFPLTPMRCAMSTTVNASPVRDHSSGRREMGTRAHVVVLPQKQAPLRIEEIELRDPGPTQVIVRQFASGICHSQLHQMHRQRQAPVILGHEATGISKSVALKSGTCTKVIWSS